MISLVNIPAASEKLLDSSGELSIPWRAYFISLQNATNLSTPTSESFTGIGSGTSAGTSTGTISYSSSVIYATGTITLFLPNAASGYKRLYDVKNAGTGLVTLKSNTIEPSVEIEGEVSQLLNPGDAVTVTSDGTKWWVI